MKVKKLLKKVFMPNIITYLIFTVVVFIWGGSFIAIEYQLGVVDESVSVFYRYFAASLIILVYIFLSKKPMLIFSKNDHVLFFLIGLFFFSLNYLFIYRGQNYLDSGTTAITFTMCLFFTQLNSKIFLKYKINYKTSIGGIIGFIGIVIIFSNDLLKESIEYTILIGLIYVLLAAFIVSLATIVTAKINNLNLPIIQVNAWAMLYGTLINLVFITFSGSSFKIDPSPFYWVSLGYLVVLGSIIGFLLYFVLVDRIGTERAAYFALMSPMVAVILSALVEGTPITFTMITGASAVILGNLIALKK